MKTPLEEWITWSVDTKDDNCRQSQVCVPGFYAVDHGGGAPDACVEIISIRTSDAGKTVLGKVCARACCRCRRDAAANPAALQAHSKFAGVEAPKTQSASFRQAGACGIRCPGTDGDAACRPVSVQCFELSQVAGITGAATGCPNLVWEPPTAWRAGTMRFRVRKSKAAPDDRGPHRTSPDSYCLAASTMIRPRPRLSR